MNLFISYLFNDAVSVTMLCSISFVKKYHRSAYQNKISHIKLLNEFNYVSGTSSRGISEQAFLYKRVDNSALHEQFDFNIRKGKQRT